jgi:hypothetical protein
VSATTVLTTKFAFKIDLASERIPRPLLWRAQGTPELSITQQG